MESDINSQSSSVSLENEETMEDSFHCLKNKTSFEDDTEKKEQDEEQSSDYEYSLRIENIRLKSKLEQVKEKASTLEKENEKFRQEIESQKNHSKKVNNKVFLLMQENQTLGENIKRMKNNEGLHGIIAKMEKEIYSLKDRLESQQRYYQKEQEKLYASISEKRRTIEQWKQTYFKSQVAVMSFRKKINHVQQYLTYDQHQKLVQCLEVMDDAYISKSDDAKYSTTKPTVNGSSTTLSKAAHNIDSREEWKKSHDDDNGATTTGQQGFKGVIVISNKPTNVNNTISQISERFEDNNQPTVFIMDEDNSIVDTISQPTSSVTHSSNEQSIKQINLNSTKDFVLRKAFSHHSSATEVMTNTVVTMATSNELQNKYNSSPVQLNSNSSYIHYPISDKKTDFVSRDMKDFTPSNVYNDAANSNAKYLELKFDAGFIKPSSATIKSFTNFPKGNLVKHETHRSHAVIPGTPLARKKIWCLKCDCDVTNNACEHTAELVIQEKEKEFPCPACGRIFNNRSHLKRHHMIHSGEKPWMCTHCDKRFNRKSHLNRHLLTHTGEKPFKCPVCQKGFADNSDLKRHRQTHEFNPENVTMTNGTASNLSQINAATHISSIQVNPTQANSSAAGVSGYISLKKAAETRFPCNICGKFFTRKSHLTRHKFTHDQQKIYCDCGRMFRQKSHLNAHLPSCKRKRELIEAKYKAEHPEEFKAMQAGATSMVLDTSGAPSSLVTKKKTNVTVKQESVASTLMDVEYSEPFENFQTQNSTDKYATDHTLVHKNKSEFNDHMTFDTYVNNGYVESQFNEKIPSVAESYSSNSSNESEMIDEAPFIESIDQSRVVSTRDMKPGDSPVVSKREMRPGESPVVSSREMRPEDATETYKEIPSYAHKDSNGVQMGEMSTLYDSHPSTNKMIEENHVFTKGFNHQESDKSELNQRLPTLVSNVPPLIKDPAI